MSSTASHERILELTENLKDIRQRVKEASALQSGRREPLLVAVSKYKPAEDILACYEQGQRDFGENYVQELVDKAKDLPQDIRWHFIGSFQTNKAKILASIPNLYTIQTIASIKAADAINRSLPPERESAPLNIFIQVNTSGEDSKSGLPPLTDASPERGELVALTTHIIASCPRLRLQGLMTIGALAESLAGAAANADFETLKRTRTLLEQRLQELHPGEASWGSDRSGDGVELLLSMGMSSDYEAALRGGSDIVRIGTGIFGIRHVKE